MGITTVIGFIALATSFMVGIGPNLSLFVDLPCVIIVVGGTVAALLISFPLKDITEDIPTKCLGYCIVPPKTRNATVDRRLSVGIEVYRQAGTYAFAAGWVGVLIGIVIMARNVADISLENFGPGLSICTLPVLYGTVISYLVCLPIRTKLARIQAELATAE